ncbi:hypothetical protein BBBOND_0202560 [Babesia bigemina]|uniref:Uncharacterized protein n=1 Tax=Babesia bigemina TaxID=5866 RepID=A0A061D850_BABBI|nr:hypothetical protein BBBOND_0202560 [Babesia bigemina]CDR95099.1 hypothetical protein BBBOND_0202560 [Babesia bigemina]|eukprot:XP_012767285.1 hypothetical protein BBBOND_0202560 [Babesia bigemina]
MDGTRCSQQQTDMESAAYTSIVQRQPGKRENRYLPNMATPRAAICKHKNKVPMRVSPSVTEHNRVLLNW